jgi:hypothetical protein
MRKSIYRALALLALCGCTQNIKNETSSFSIVSELSGALREAMSTPELVDTRKTVTRQIIESAGIPLLFIEKESGQNGTLALYPGSNTLETWLGADGATVSLNNGELVATRGLGNDLMGSIVPRATTLKERLGNPYTKTMRFLTADDQNDDLILECTVRQFHKSEEIVIFEKSHEVLKYFETCKTENYALENLFWQNAEGLTIMSKQFHSPSVGQLLIMRLK